MTKKYTLTYLKRGVKAKVTKLWLEHQPDFIIVGAQKAGTTSLHFYLDQHPKIIGSNPKEVRFFDRDENYKKGRDWYKKAFVNTRNPIGNHLYFEATPEYLYRSYAAQRIFEFNSNMKLIVLLRDPIKRAYSAWNMYRDFLISRKTIPDILTRGYIDNQPNNIFEELYRNGFPSFAEVVQSEIAKIESGSRLEEPSFLRRGIYCPQIQRYVNYFGRDKIMIIAFKDLVGDNKKETLNNILHFLGLPKYSWSQLKDEKQNAREYSEPLSEYLQEQLNEFYAPHNERLFDFLGHIPNW